MSGEVFRLDGLEEAAEVGIDGPAAFAVVRAVLVFHGGGEEFFVRRCFIDEAGDGVSGESHEFGKGEGESDGH
jgi:hypothetical protein